MIADATVTTFAIYRWANPYTTSDYPFLAVAQDRSAILSLGSHRVSFEWGIPDEAGQWLAHDFARTGECLDLDLCTVQHLLSATFRDGAEFGVATFGRDLGPSGLQLALAAQDQDCHGPEYVIQGFGSYQRRYRDPEELEPVMPSERVLLDVCSSRFAELAGQCVAKLTAPPPPRYRSW